MEQDLRSFITGFEAEYPQDVVRVAEPVGLEYQMMALVMEYERRGRYPIIIFENVQGHHLPVVCNVMAGRRTLAKALGAPEPKLSEEYARRLEDYVPPVVMEEPLFRQMVRTGDDADLGQLPIPTYFPGDGGPYLTAGMLVAKHPDTGVVTEGYHRASGEGASQDGVQPSLPTQDVRVSAPLRGEGRGHASGHMSGATPASRHGVSVLPASWREQVRGLRGAIRRADGGGALLGHRLGGACVE